MDGERRCSGKEFHVLGAATRKLRLPNSILVDGTLVYAVARCLSVCLSVTPVYCIQTAKDIVKPFTRPDSPTSDHSNVLRPSGVTHFQGKPTQQGR